jgi:uncharacterized lipoprotein YajG
MKLRSSFPALALAVSLAACAAPSPVQTHATDIVCDKQAPIEPATAVPMCDQREE